MSESKMRQIAESAANALSEYATRKAFSLSSVVGADWIQGGNAFGAKGVVGTLDAFDMSIISGGVQQANLSNASQTLTLGVAAGYSIVSAGGQLGVDAAVGQTLNLGNSTANAIGIGHAGATTSITGTFNSVGAYTQSGGSVALLSNGAGSLSVGNGVGATQLALTMQFAGSFAALLQNVANADNAGGLEVTAGSNAGAGGAALLQLQRPDATVLGTFAQFGTTGLSVTSPGAVVLDAGSSLSLGTGTATTTVIGRATAGTSTTLNSPILLGNTALGDFPAGGSIGTAAATVDTFPLIFIAQTTAGQILTLPVPTAATAGRLLVVSNTGSTSFTMLAQTVSPDTGIEALWNGLTWTFVA